MIIVLEGLDGVGKSTQIDLLMHHFTNAGYDCCFTHFPRLHQEPAGPLIETYLQGGFGAIDQISPYLIAPLYAQDQYLAARDEWSQNPNKIIFLDRYYYSNLAYQTTRIPDEKEKEKFRIWLKNMIKILALPKPELALYLHAPREFRNASLHRRTQTDIHEKNCHYQESVHLEYLNMCAENWHGLREFNCADDNGLMQEQYPIHKKILSLLYEYIKPL